MVINEWVNILLLVYAVITLPMLCGVIIEYVYKKYLEMLERHEDLRQMKEDLSKMRQDVSKMKIDVILVERDIECLKDVTWIGTSSNIKKDFPYLFKDSE